MNTGSQRIASRTGLPFISWTMCLLIASCIFQQGCFAKTGKHPVPEQPLGVSIGWEWMALRNEANLAKVMDQLGAKHTRINIAWQQTEPDIGVYKYEELDTFMKNIAKSDCEVVMNLRSVSPWGTTARKKHEYFPASPPKDMSQFTQWVTRMVNRYKSYTRYWQIGNEWEVSAFWTGTPDEFVAYFNAASNAVKKEDPNAIVILGGVQGYDNEPGSPHYNSRIVKDMDRVFAGTVGHFDILDVHLYEDTNTIGERIAWHRDRLGKLGYRGPIWSTECGGPDIRRCGHYYVYIKEAAKRTKEKNKTSTTEISKEDRAGNWRKTMIELKKMYPEMQAECGYLRMFIDKEVQDLRLTLHRQEIVKRHLMAISAGLEKVFWWNLSTTGKSPLFGSMGLTTQGESSIWMVSPITLDNKRPAYSAHVLLAEKIKGVCQMQRRDRNDCVIFDLWKEDGSRLVAAWKLLEPHNYPGTPVSLRLAVPFKDQILQTDISGKTSIAKVTDGRLDISLTEAPVFIEERP